MSKVAAVVVSFAPISRTVKSRKAIQTRYFTHGYFRRLWPATTRESPRATHLRQLSPVDNGFSPGSLERRLKYCRFAAREDVTPLHRPLKQSFAIRRASVADCAAILECLLPPFAPYREGYTPERV